MSPKVDEGLSYTKFNKILKWGPDRHWWVEGYYDHEIWKFVDTGEGWELDNSDNIEGAALVAPLSILFWEKE